MATRTYLTPGVYVEEISTLPPSVAPVATAIPAFIGCTQKAPGRTESDAVVVIRRIETMLEYETCFGEAPPTTFEVRASQANGSGPYELKVERTPEKLTYHMYYGVYLYFQNGGGPCYIVSVGANDYKTPPTSDDFDKGLLALETEDEPTLILLTDAVTLDTYYNTLCPKALAQCAKLQDRFTIMDVKSAGDAANVRAETAAFRNDVGMSDLHYGAAYYPYLQTALSYVVDEDKVTVNQPLGEPAPGSDTDATNVEADAPESTPVKETLKNLKESQTALYNAIKLRLAQEQVVLPPSSAIAGVYARVDRERGVWKAPANVSLTGVIRPQIKISDEEQGDMNVDPNSGKSINAIRAFAGKGTLVWGARTLDGNSNEWRYVSVRRLFIMIEESIQKAMSMLVFEPNDATTWLKGKAMIDSFLYGLWEQGGLAGASPKDAYIVDVGLGNTMTPQDVLEGRMIFQVHVAPVRPAEFIVLQFMQKLQTS